MKVRFWIREGSRVSGPFWAQQIKAYAAGGQLRPEHLVSTDRERWRSAGAVDGLAFGGDHVTPISQKPRTRGTARAFACPCGTRFRVTSPVRGQKHKCPDCGRLLALTDIRWTARAPEPSQAAVQDLRATGERNPPISRPRQTEGPSQDRGEYALADDDEVRSSASPVRECAGCGEAATNGNVICTECGCNVLTGRAPPAKRAPPPSIAAQTTIGWKVAAVILFVKAFLAFVAAQWVSSVDVRQLDSLAMVAAGSAWFTLLTTCACRILLTYGLWTERDWAVPLLMAAILASSIVPLLFGSGHAPPGSMVTFYVVGTIVGAGPRLVGYRLLLCDRGRGPILLGLLIVVASEWWRFGVYGM